MKLQLKSNLLFVTVDVHHRGNRMGIPNVLLDTGSSSTVFSADLMAQIGIVPEPQDMLHTIRGVGGAEVVFLRQVDFLQVGHQGLHDFQIEVGGMDYGFALNGILGMDYLIQSGGVINLHELLMTFQPVPALAGRTTVLSAVAAIQQKFAEAGGEAQIPLLRGGTFGATAGPDGVTVTNLGHQPFLPWAAFQEAVCVLTRNGGRATRGSAQGARLGEPGLSLESVEGHVAHVVFGKQPGQWVFQRIAPIACILFWAGVCRAEPGELVLLDNPWS
jgi:hypothetical protein